MAGGPRGRPRPDPRAPPRPRAPAGRHRDDRAAPPQTEAAGEPEVPADAATEAPAEERAPEGDRGLLANSRSMAVASLASRITGFLRSVMLVAALGTGAVANAYN